MAPSNGLRVVYKGVVFLQAASLYKAAKALSIDKVSTRKHPGRVYRALPCGV